MFRMAVIDNCYPCNAQVVDAKGTDVKFLEYPEPLKADGIAEEDKFANYSREDLNDWEFVGYESVPVFRMKRSAAERFVREFDCDEQTS